jgi:DnaJ domain
VAPSSHYDILDVSPSATTAEIRAAYRRLVTQVHPDAGGSKALFRLVQEAYEALSAGADGIDRRSHPSPTKAQNAWTRAVVGQQPVRRSTISLLV